jgi:Mn-dependent DtxR family transcriptional regulator
MKKVDYDTAFLILPLKDLTDKNLSLTEVAILSQIAYIKKAFKDVWPSNTYLGKILNVSPRSIQRAINNLTINNYITYTVKNNNKRYVKMTDKCNSTYKELFKNTKSKEILINNDVERNPLLDDFLNKKAPK